ncbi:MAG: nucleotidyl transferase AbiEii/AbiGii toxin family protein [Candidatus Nealsonbacteria bacterium]|nr:nucleotidyl transferase AbiEii/AbiGii toxin family protein [Candidatus Nealsonbacteria bacterium]
MLNREKHQLIMGKILRDFYSDVSISPLLGLKGGTCAYFFYNLSRFSVDLDFDLLSKEKENEKIVFEKIIDILSKYGDIKNQYIKKFTLFALLSYGDNEHNIKIEISTKELMGNIKEYYEIREHLGIPMFVARKDYLFSSKLFALIHRKETAMRDIYDIHYFAKNNWDINKELIERKTGKSVKEYLEECFLFIEKRKGSQMLQGLGELVGGEKEKEWIKKHLKADTIFMLKNYISVLK